MRHKFFIHPFQLSTFLLIAFFVFVGCKRAPQPSDDQSTDSNIVELNPIQMKQITLIQ